MRISAMEEGPWKELENRFRKEAFKDETQSVHKQFKMEHPQFYRKEKDPGKGIVIKLVVLLVFITWIGFIFSVIEESSEERSDDTANGNSPSIALCVDSDSQDFFNRGYAKYINPEGRETIIYDQCIDDGALKGVQESICEDGLISFIFHACECRMGACLG